MGKPALRCRVCWVKEKRQCLVPVLNPYAERPQTIKEAILLCVPTSTIKDDNFICKLCLEQLTPAFQFVALCLETEKLLMQETNRKTSRAHETHIENETDDDDDDNQDCGGLNECSEEQHEQPSENIERGENDAELTAPGEEFPSELAYLRDLDLNNLGYISVPIKPSPELEESLVQDGVNVVNLSTSPSKNKRMILLTRDLELLFRNVPGRNLDIYLERKGDKCQGVFCCKDCPAKIDDDYRFQMHCVVFHRNSKPFKCTRCRKKFAKYSHLVKHEKYYDGQEKCCFQCPRCKKTFKTKPEMKRHQDDVADAPFCRYIKCKVCSIKFKKEDFKAHCKEHANFLCVKCGECLSSAVSLSSHERNAHSSSTSESKSVNNMCDKCGKIFKSSSGLRLHMKAAHTGELYICDKCARPFSSKNCLNMHYNMKHSTKRSSGVFFCDKCNKVCLSKQGFSSHIRTTHPDGNAVITEDASNKHDCPICYTSCTTELELQNHEMECHANDNPSRLRFKSNRACVCRICDKVLSKVHTLKLHYKGHLGLRDNECHICGRRIQTYLSLKRHLKKHTTSNDKISCNICHTVKSSIIELEEHMEQMHLKKKYKCKYCPKKFGLKMLWLSHESTEHEEINAKKESLLRTLMSQPIYLRDRQYKFPGLKGSKFKPLRMNVDELEEKLGNSDGLLNGDNQPLKFVVEETNAKDQGELIMEDEYACQVLENYELMEQ